MKFAAIAILVSCVQIFAGTVTEKSTEKEQFSYSIGQDIGKSMADFKEEVDLALVMQGMKDQLEKNSSALNDSVMNAIKQQVFARLSQQMEEKSAKLAAENKAKGDAFLAENRKKKGVVTTSSGLQYSVVTQGKGAVPGATDMVTVHYSGSLLNGKEFDSSYKREEPAVFPVNQVIPGWTELLQLMPVGSHYKVWIPSELAYGDRGAGADIGPGEMLIFEVELLSTEQQSESADELSGEGNDEVETESSENQ